MNRSESKYFNTAVKMDRALIALLETKDFAYITVSEICKTAGVNRSTFYLHYETVGDLLEETTRYVLDGFLSYFPADTQDAARVLQGDDLSRLNFITEQYMRPYLSYIRDNRRVFATAVANRSTLGFDRVFRKMYEQIFDPILERFDYPEIHRPYVMQFYLNGVTALVSYWLQQDCRDPIEEVMAALHTCIFGRDPHLLAEIAEQP